MTDAHRATCATLSHFLHAARRVGTFGLLLSTAALVLASRHPDASAWTVVVLVLGGIERLLALRVDFDARLFGSMARGTLPDLSTLDMALGALGWRKGGAPRSLELRVRGAQALVLQHATVVGLQGACVGMLAGRVWA